MSRLRHLVLALPLLTAWTAQAESPACLRIVTLQPGQPARVPLSGESILIEEVGTDVDYRWSDTGELASIATPPDRLGFDVIPVRGRTLILRTRAGQGSGQVRLSTCLADSELAFFRGLAELQRRSLENGKDAAQAALPALEYLSHWPLPATHAGWVSSAHANVLASAGENNAAEKMFLDSSRHWHEAGRPDRAAIALMAAGDNASRANRFDDARAWLTQARDELERLGVTYYALRSASSLCTVLSRSGRYRDAIACEESVIPLWTAQQEKRETAVRHISAANLRLRFDEHDEAQRHLLSAEAVETNLPPLVRARLQTSLGNQALSRGNLPEAAARYARATNLLGGNGLPTEQANLDIKLAQLARFAGAWPERIRLLDAALKRLNANDDALRVAEITLLLAETQLQRADAAAALDAARRGQDLCAAPAANDCREFAASIETRALILLGQTEAARARFAAIDPKDSRVSNASRHTLLAARLELASGDATRALQRPQKPIGAVDPDLQTEHALLFAEALSQSNRHDEALESLRLALTAQAAATTRWPSAALRVSARDRLAQLQSALFERALRGDEPTVAADKFAVLRSAIDAGAATYLFAGSNDANLPAALRANLSASVTDGGIVQQRELFAVLAATGDKKMPAAPALRLDTEPSAGPGSPTPIVILPLGGDEHFHLLTHHDGTTRRCLRWPIARYRALATRFDAALDGSTSELTELQGAAEDLYAAIRQCGADLPTSTPWQVVIIPGTPALPWAWVAATANARDEPTVSNVLVVDERAPAPFAMPQQLLLLDLDMPGAAPLPFASREIDVLRTQSARSNVDIRHVRAVELGADEVLRTLTSARAVHVLGHANPAAFGQLYQGLWYESNGKPSLLTYPEIAAARTGADLVVLSACGTRAADSRAFAATSRLAEAFIAAGAKHVVAASNPLSDNAAPIWTERFYTALALNPDVAAASRTARAALRTSPHFRAPRYWAGIEYFLSSPAPQMHSAVRTNRAGH